MPSESQIVRSPSISTGTCPVGEKARNAAWLSDVAKGSIRSSNAMPSAFINNHGLSDQLE